MIDVEAAKAAFEPLRVWLVQRRIDLGIAREDLARAIGLRRPDQLKAWEEGRHVPTIMWLEAWCRGLYAFLTITPEETYA